MTIYSEKDYLLKDDVAEVSTNTVPTFKSLLSKPLLCLPSMIRSSRNVDMEVDGDGNGDGDGDGDCIEDYNINIDYPEDDEPLKDLPYQSSNDSQLKSRLSVHERLSKLRQIMKIHNIGVYIIPSEDEHQSEYTADADKRREFISGFTGSAGICIVSLDDGDNLTGSAALSTDGRYFLQASKQLNFNDWELLKQGDVSYPKWTQYAINKAVDNKFSNVLSCDPRLINVSVGEFFNKASKVQYLNRFTFKPFADYNLIDRVWGLDKPQRSLDPIYPYAMKYAGESVNSKLARVRQKLTSDTMKGSCLILTALDDIAWLLNLRCDSDVSFTPVFFSYCIVTLDGITLYINKAKIDNGNPELHKHLSEIENLSIKPYDDFYNDLSTIKSTIDSPNTSIVLPSKSNATYAILSSLPSSSAKLSLIYESIVSYMKIYKNETELFNSKIAQYKDSLSIILYASWLEHQLINKKKTINEYEGACKIYSIRTKFPNFKGLSFECISSSGANASVIHYAPSKEENSIINPDDVYLIDTGGHYLEGTTDITRTFKFGDKNLKAEDKKFYTLVLKGHIAVAMAKFPPNSAASSAILDSYSRQSLWNEGLDFNHGSGHGVGSFGLVHEGPLYFLTTSGGPSGESLFKPGGIITIEPGYYVDGVKGFRVESEMEIIQCDDNLGKTRNGTNFLGFNYLTKVPFCRALIDTSYLSPVEINWINKFHSSIRSDFGDKVLDLGDKRAYNWLMRETSPL